MPVYRPMRRGASLPIKARYLTSNMKSGCTSSIVLNTSSGSDHIYHQSIISSAAKAFSLSPSPVSEFIDSFGS